MSKCQMMKFLNHIQRCKILLKLTRRCGLNFLLDAKNEEKVKKILKISLALPLNLLANVSGWMKFYTPDILSI